MDEVLKPEEEQLSTLAAQMGLHVPDAPVTGKPERPKDGPAQKSYAQLT